MRGDIYPACKKSASKEGLKGVSHTHHFSEPLVWSV